MYTGYLDTALETFNPPLIRPLPYGNIWRNCCYTSSITIIYQIQCSSISTSLKVSWGCQPFPINSGNYLNCANVLSRKEYQISHDVQDLTSSDSKEDVSLKYKTFIFLLGLSNCQKFSFRRWECLVWVLYRTGLWLNWIQLERDKTICKIIFLKAQSLTGDWVSSELAEGSFT